MTRRVIRLCGEGMRGTKVSALLLRDLLDILIEGTKRVMRLQVEGRSTARGTQPGWLEQAAAFDLVAIEEGSTRLVLDAPTLAEALPDKFSQAALFGGVDAGRSSLDYLTDSLRDAASANEESELFDGAVIQTFSKLDRLMRRGVEVIEVTNDMPFELRAAGIANIGNLKSRIPPSRHVRLAGKLETIQYSDRRFVLLQHGTSIRGVADEGITPAQLASLFGKQVIVSGDAHFRPSGSLLRIEAERIEAAKGDVSVWETVPRPLLGAEATTDLHRRQGPRSGFNSIFGQWPGDESDHDIDEALRELS